MKKILLILTITSTLYLSLKAQTDTNLIFYDYNPDILLANDTDKLSIDVNQDGILDYIFYCLNYSGGPDPYFRNLDTNCSFSAFTVDSNDSLDMPSIIWHTGNWFWYDDIIFGLKFMLGNNIYYGWIQATTIGSPIRISVDKYAFCKIPNYPFQVGQTEIITSIASQESNDSTVVYVSDSGSGVVVQSSKTITNVSLTNIQGVVVSSQSYINSGNATISTAGFAHGTYIVQVKFSDGGVFTKQIGL